jgi:tRNA A37 threonylcarbamoyladenosine biosynthesis protein TsaE
MATTLNDRLVLQRARTRLSNSKAFVLVTWDGDNMPIYHYDIRKCTNRADLRHITIHEAASLVVAAIEKGNSALHKRIKEDKESERVQAAKDKRSEVLRAAGENERTIESNHDIPNSPAVAENQSTGTVSADNRPAVTG